MMENKDNKICFLNLIYPFTITYMSLVIGNAILKNGMTKNTTLDIILITLVSLGFVYGVLSFIREIKEGKIFDTLKYWINKLFK